MDGSQARESPPPQRADPPKPPGQGKKRRAHRPGKNHSGKTYCQVGRFGAGNRRRHTTEQPEVGIEIPLDTIRFRMSAYAQKTGYIQMKPESLPKPRGQVRQFVKSEGKPGGE